MRILILHSVRNLASLRRTTLNQSFFLLKCAPWHDYTLQCYGHPIAPAVREGGFDAVIIDTTFLWYRWSRPRSILAELHRDYAFVADWDIPKIALPQDDYDHCDILDDWLADWRVQAVFTPLAQYAALLYRRMSQKARILPCLTGHVDVADIALAERWAKPFSERRIDVGYRAAELPAQFGRLGRLKSEIGARFVDALGRDSGLVVDVSTDPKDVLAGDRWLRFLGDSRFTLGAPSGSSLVDRRGLIQDAIRQYLGQHPTATFDEIEAACFPGEDGNVELVGPGPRNIEAGLAQSCQLLVPHPGLLPFEPDVHFIPLAADCGNIGEVRAQMRDGDLVAKRVAACRELLIDTPDLGYARLSERILAEIERLRETAAAPRDAVPKPSDAVLSLLEEQRVLVRLAAAEVGAAAARRSDELPAPLVGGAQRDAAALRVGRAGAIREFFRINDALDATGNIIRPEPWPLALRAYWRFRQLRSLIVLGATARQRDFLRPRDWLRRLHAGRPDTVQGGSFNAPHLKRTLQGWRTAGPAGLLRMALGQTVGRRKTVTMIVADNAIDRRVLLSARSLHQAGWKVTVVALPFPNWPDSIDDDRLLFPEVAIARINPYWPVRLPAGGRGLLERIEMWRQVFPYYPHFLDLALLAPAEVYVAHDLPALPAAATAAEMLNATLVYDAHELYPEQRIFDADRVAFLGQVERELIHRPRLVTTVNRSIADEISRRYAIAAPTVILNAPAAPDSGLPVTRSNLLRERLGLPANCRVLLFQGKASVHRNLETLVTAMGRVTEPTAVLVLMGPDGGILGELRRIAAELGLLDRRVYFLDAVRQDMLLPWTASADIGVIPYPPVDLNSRLCTPNKLFEYIVAELPILANDLPELRHYVAANGFGQNHAMEGPQAMAAAIDAMCRSDLGPYREALQRRAAEFVWDVQGRKLTALYDGLRRSERVAPTDTAALVASPGE